MVSGCAVVGCTVNFSKIPKPKLYRIPAVMSKTNKSFDPQKNEILKIRRSSWMRALKRGEFDDNSINNMRVCDKHFLSGKPSDLNDVNNPDLAPCVNMGYDVGFSLKRTSDRDRHERASKKSKPDNETNSSPLLRELLNEEIYNNTCIDELVEVEENGPENELLTNTLLDKSVQTDLNMEDIDHLYIKFKEYENLIDELKKTKGAKSFVKDSFFGKDKRTKFYTGLDSYKTLFTLHEFIHPDLSNESNTALSSFQQIILTLMKLRLDLCFADLADRFDISEATVSRIFRRTLFVMANALKPLIHWPERDVLKKTMPECFKSFKGVIIDCFEVFIQKSSNLLVRAETWSQYKHHNTAKVLIAITGQGSISYISDAWGGRASDKYIVENSTFLSHIVPGDTVLADRGFLIPAFTKGKSQLHPVEIEKTREIANVRIHVERAIGSLRQKYTILESTLPISILCPEEDGVSAFDKILIVCSALFNLCKSIIK